MKSRLSFYAVFILVIILAGFATYRNLSDYRLQNEIQISGVRTSGKVIKCQEAGSKRQIEVAFAAEGSEYVTSKKVSSVLAVGDSVAVYYLPDNPEHNGVAVE